MSLSSPLGFRPSHWPSVIGHQTLLRSKRTSSLDNFETPQILTDPLRALVSRSRRSTLITTISTGCVRIPYSGHLRRPTRDTAFHYRKKEDTRKRQLLPSLAIATSNLGNAQNDTRTSLHFSLLTTILETPEGLLIQRLKTMHLALPARKSSNPPPYATRSTRFPMLRRSRVQAMVICACAVGAVIFILSQVLGSSEGIPAGTPLVVIVTVLDPDSYTTDYINNIKENRMEYAKKHGMGLSVSRKDSKC